LRLLTVLLLFVLGCAAAPSSFRVASDREDMGLKGPVKSVREKSVGVPRGEPKSPGDGWAFDTLTTFDGQGRKAGEETCDPEGKSWGRSVFTRQDGWSTETRYHADGTLFQRLVIKERLDRASGTLRTTVTVTMGDYEGAPHSETIETRGAREWRAESSYFLPDGKLSSRSTTRFGADGEVEEFVGYNADGAVTERNVRIAEGMRHYLYGPDGAVTLTVTLGREVCLESDPHGNCKRETATRTIVKPGGVVVKVDEVVTRAFTYY
jgi:hypothetical protein